MGLSVGGNWWDQLGTSIGDSMIGMADPFGSLNPADPMARQNAIRSSVGAMGAGMLANSRKRPMEAFGSAFQSAQQQGQQNSMNALQAQNLMLGMDKTKKDMAWESGERQGTLEARDAEEQRKKDMAAFVEQQMANPEIPQKNKATAMFFMKAGDYEKAYQALQPPGADPYTLGPGQQRFENNKPVASVPPNESNGITITNPDGTVTQIGGKAPKVTEAMTRARGFMESMKSSVAAIEQNFDVLATPQNYLGNAAESIGGRAIMTPQGQQAADDFSEVVSSMLYIASGATLREEEITRKMKALMPYPNDDATTIARKKQRLQDLKNAVAVMGGLPPEQQSMPSPQQDGESIIEYDENGNPQ